MGFLRRIRGSGQASAVSAGPAAGLEASTATHLRVEAIAEVEPAGPIAIDAARWRVAVACQPGVVAWNKARYRVVDLRDGAVEVIHEGAPQGCKQLVLRGDLLVAAEGTADFGQQGWLHDLCLRGSRIVRHDERPQTRQASGARSGRLGSSCVCVSPSGRYVVLDSFLPTDSLIVRLPASRRDLPDGDVDVIAREKHDFERRAWVWSPDGKMLVRANGGVFVHVLEEGEDSDIAKATPIEIESGKHDLTEEGADSLISLDFSRDSRWLAAGRGHGRTGVLKVFDMRSRTLLHELGDLPSVISSLCFTPSGRFLVSGDRDGRLTVWKLEAEVAPKLTPVAHGGLDGEVTGLAVAQAQAGLLAAHKTKRNRLVVSRVSLPGGID